MRGEIELLDADGAREYLAEVRERTLAAIDARGIDPGGARDGHPPRAPAHRDDAPGACAWAACWPRATRRCRPSTAARRRSGSTSPPDPPCSAPADDGFAYDNERPRHAVELGAFRIARRPVTNATWLHFTEGGGYQRREWWSDEGWAWKEDYDIGSCPDAEAGHPDAPVCHVSWFEADAFARSRGARLPTEAEWEKAATWTQGDLQGIGQVWEWTTSWFDGYPGFVAHPYREYSEVFFGAQYRVLRGGSWATRPARRHPHLPQLGPPPAPADLRRRPPRQRSRGEQMTPLLTTDAIVVESFVGPKDERSLADDVLDGLTRPFKELPPKHFYDARGAELFEQICELPEYYPTRAERAILEERSAEIVEATGAAELVELGSGTAAKTRLLLRRDGRRRARCAATCRST